VVTVHDLEVASFASIEGNLTLSTVVAQRVAGRFELEAYNHVA
jgi:hypothetical protein